ncbi:transcription regulator gcr1 [Gigaspora margarita]|uniref:Transcription regulator gcr1 n=1 Tax=Gigaspora margarita TaxID=4874 RepID=A0A8H4APJ2_GIGMA|nr:transcription regulator gcr1 [Gigaspora margarita]
MKNSGNHKRQSRGVTIHKPPPLIPLILPTSVHPQTEWITFNEAVSVAAERINKKIPYYMLPVLGNLPSVHHIYAEWYFGLDGNPAITTLIEKYGKDWIDDNKARLCRRKFLIHEIEMREMQHSTAEALVLLDGLRGDDGLNKLVDVKLLGRPR